MNLEMKLRIQAWVDGELPEAESSQVRGLVERDAEARGLAAHLEAMHTAVVGNETEVKLLEAREFYWSKIRREIERLDHIDAASSTEAGTWWAAWRRWLKPVVGTALVAAVAVALTWAILPRDLGTDSFLTEVENLSDDVGSYSFRAPGENMFVVWVYDKTEPSGSDSELPPETTVQ